MKNGDIGDTGLGWIGAGRMGFRLVTRLLEGGCDVAVYNRTRAKAEPLAELGATIVDSPIELAQREIVFTVVSGPEDFKQVVLGPNGLLAAPRSALRIIVDATTVSPRASREVRAEAENRGVALLASPVSGNPMVVEAGRLTLVVSGPEDAYAEATPYLDLLGAGVTYVGEGERARLAKICHNLMLGVVAQSMAEVTILAEKGGIPRAAFLEFLNNSVMGSMFTRYKTPAYVNLDFSPTFTPPLLGKDFDLGFDAADELDVPLPVAAAARDAIRALIEDGYTETDFAALIERQARASTLELKPEDAAVSDGLGAVTGRDGGRLAASSES